MKDFFLRAKPWMLFIPIIIPTVATLVFQYFYMQWIFEMQDQALAGADPFDSLAFDVEAARKYVVGGLLLAGLAYGTQVGWYHSVVTGLHKYLPVGTDLSLKRFRVATIVAAGYLSLILIGGYMAFNWVADVFPGFMDAAQSSSNEPPFDVEEMFPTFLLIWAVCFFGGILGIIAIIFMAYYTGKTIRCIEEDKPLRGSAVVGYGVLSYFLFIGIWVLQPKVNRLLETGTMAQEEVKPW